ncbi:hypothetical protein ONZ45_g12991 [Pleurotus djamor]|nr:hypothetical protein ONZ45_g12991 [Pleurotus djamor]
MLSHLPTLFDTLVTRKSVSPRHLRYTPMFPPIVLRQATPRTVALTLSEWLITGSGITLETSIEAGSDGEQGSSPGIQATSSSLFISSLAPPCSFPLDDSSTFPILPWFTLLSIKTFVPHPPRSSSPGRSYTLLRLSCSVMRLGWVGVPCVADAVGDGLTIAGH